MYKLIVALMLTVVAVPATAQSNCICTTKCHVDSGGHEICVTRCRGKC